MEQLLPYLPLLVPVLTTCVIAFYRFLTIWVLSRRPDIKSIQPSIYGYSFQKFDAPTLPPTQNSPEQISAQAEGQLLNGRKGIPGKGKKRSRALA